VSGIELRDDIVKRINNARDYWEREKEGLSRVPTLSRMETLPIGGRVSDLERITQVQQDHGIVPTTTRVTIPEEPAENQSTSSVETLVHSREGDDATLSVLSHSRGTSSPEPAQSSSGQQTPLDSVVDATTQKRTSTLSSGLSSPGSTTSNATASLAPIQHTLDFVKNLELPTEAFALLPRPINLQRTLLKPSKRRHFVCLTIGSRGDVQYVVPLRFTSLI
jgi:hypothetical protein